MSRVLIKNTHVLYLNLNKMNERQGQLLRYIVEEYVATASPVGSPVIAEKYFPDLSSATIRNEMVELENIGLINQPYTSAGRIPTVNGLRYYINNYIFDAKLQHRERESLDNLQLTESRESIKNLAKTIAEISGDAVVIGFNPLDVYYTGLSNLFSQSEFNNYNLVCSMSQVIDGLDRVMSKVFHQASDIPEVMLGDSNPFGDSVATVLVKTNFCNQDLLVGILGLLRMDYKKNVALSNYVKELINNIKT